MLKCLDLCAGLGGFSEAFVKSPHWEVMRIDNNPLLENVSNMQIIDIFEFRDTLNDMISRGYKPEQPDIILASPPCTEYSLAYASPRSKAQRAGVEYVPNMDILHCVLEIIEMLEPKYYIIENVRGAIKFFTPILGKYHTQINGAYFFWGRFPALNILEDVPKKSDHGRWSTDPLRANYRGLIPIQISDAILRAVECQRTLDFWC